MGKLVLDAAIREQLTKLGKEVELYDESGSKIGVFLSPAAYLELLFARVQADPTPEDREAARADYRQRGGLTTAEILAHLRRLEEEGKSSE
jgi:hypothetical protein